MEPAIITAASLKLAELLSILREKAKDRSIAALVQQIQAEQQTIHTALYEEQAKSLDLKREMFQMEQSHAKAIAERDAEIAKLKTELDNWDIPPEDQAMAG